MATTRQYWNNLTNARQTIARFMGVDYPSLPKDIRAGDSANLAIIAIVIKALTDNGVLTDAQIIAARDAAILDVWTEEPTLP